MLVKVERGAGERRDEKRVLVAMELGWEWERESGRVVGRKGRGRLGFGLGLGGGGGEKRRRRWRRR